MLRKLNGEMIVFSNNNDEKNRKIGYPHVKV